MEDLRIKVKRLETKIVQLNDQLNELSKELHDKMKHQTEKYDKSNDILNKTPTKELTYDQLEFLINSMNKKIIYIFGKNISTYEGLFILKILSYDIVTHFDHAQFDYQDCIDYIYDWKPNFTIQSLYDAKYLDQDITKEASKLIYDIANNFRKIGILT